MNICYRGIDIIILYVEELFIVSFIICGVNYSPGPPNVHELVCVALNKSSTSCVRVKFPICLELCPYTHRWSLEDIPTPSVGSERRSRTDGRPGLTSHQDCA